MPESLGDGTNNDQYRVQLRCIQHQAAGNWPAARSAHNLVATRDGWLLLLAGDSGVACQRFSDLWLLQSPASQPMTWQNLTQPQQQPQNVTSYRIKEDDDADDKQRCCSGSVGYTARSNSSAAVAGDWLCLFGGWDSTGLQPLGQLEAYNLRTKTWHIQQPPNQLTPELQPLHQQQQQGPEPPDQSLGTKAGVEFGPRPRGQPAAAAAAAAAQQGPSPRGQPAAAANSAGTAVYVFGGWDGQQRFNDLWKLQVSDLDLHDWIWELVQPADGTAAAAAARDDNVAAAAATMPCPRADHVMVCWHYCDDGVWKDLLVVFGGSSNGGLLNDVWLFDIRANKWSQAFSGGTGPRPRSSCAAAIAGDTLLLHGGQTAAGVLDDMYLLQLSNLTWIQVDLGPVTYPLCRHSMAVSHDCCWIFGGYTGSSGSSSSMIQIDLQPVLQLQRSSIEDVASRMACCGCIITEFESKCSTAASAAGSSPAKPAAAAAVVKVLNKKAAPAPMKLSDLPNTDEVAGMPQWKQVRILHQAALAAGCDMYVDPKTGYSVFTARYLQQRECCGNKCRHCPWGWKNVAKAGTVTW